MLRRDLLKLLAVGAASGIPARAQSPASAAFTGAVARYLESLARPDGGYGWDDQEIGHLTPTFAVIGSYRLLRQPLPRREALAEYVRTHHPSQIKKLEQERRVFDFQQLQALVWLEADVAAFRPKIAAWTKPLAYLKQYERNGYPVLQSELGAVFSHALIGLPVDGLAAGFTPYLDQRRRPNGSYHNTPAADGGDGHVMNTWWALQAEAILGRPVPDPAALAAWLRSCQRPNGGFTYQPRPEAGGVDDVAYTRAAVRALALLGGVPADRDGCIRYLHSLGNADGGFGDRPGWYSNAPATYCALDALEALGALDTLGRIQRRAAPRATALPAGLKVWSIQIEAHGQGSPRDAVELARALRIDLWGAKNARPGWMERAEAIARAEQVPVTFFTANEEYGTWVNFAGFGTYSHTSDIIAPAGAEIGPSLAKAGAVSWSEFRQRRLDPLQRGGGRLIWQFGENEELVRMLLDDSVERGGFAAISTFHFGNPDFTNTEPFLKRWRGRLAYIALQDAHGPEPWWFADMTTGCRTLFLAPASTWEGWLQALQNDWVVAVRRDGWTRGRTWMHGGNEVVRRFVRERESDWRWWDNPRIARPMVSVVAIAPAEEFEVGRPERGVALRVRCAWENTAQGLPKQPLAEFVRLLVDEREVPAELTERKRPNGQREDHYHRALLPDLRPGRHRATAIVRTVADAREISRTVQFET